MAVAAELAGQHVGGGRRGQGEEQHQHRAFHRRQLQPAADGEGQQRHAEQAHRAVPAHGRHLGAQFLRAQRGADAEQAERQAGRGEQVEQALAAAVQAEAGQVQRRAGEAGEDQRVAQDRHEQAAQVVPALGGQRPHRHQVHRRHHQRQHQRRQVQSRLSVEAAHRRQPEVGVEAQHALGEGTEARRVPAAQASYPQQRQPGDAKAEQHAQRLPRQPGIVQRRAGQAAEQQGGEQDEVVEPLRRRPELVAGKALAAQQPAADDQCEEWPEGLE
ncbi:hypothetical protein D3C76_863900 [compost metagenome]